MFSDKERKNQVPRGVFLRKTTRKLMNLVSHPGKLNFRNWQLVRVVKEKD
ncbi:Uncharacterised protein [Chlamydia trachomatis]|nr:Uncharacterised protein [Chlamydia trachomatis]